MNRRFLLVGEVGTSWARSVQRAVDSWASLDVMEEEEAQRAVAEGDYALVVIDAGATEDAAALTSWLRALQPDLPIVVATASPTWQRARQVLKAGATDYIRKTLDAEETRSEIGAVLHLKDSS